MYEFKVFGLYNRKDAVAFHSWGPEHFRAQVATTRPVGRSRPSASFYPARHLVSTPWQRRALT